jgi:GNAT superfamily N-acetyltransferase
VPVVVVRPAVPADARSIATVHVDAWRVAYAHIFKPGYFDQERLSLDHREDMWRNEITALEPGRGVDVAEAGDEIVAFCAFGPARDEDIPGLGEIYAVYVAPTHWSRGAGRALMETAGLTLLGQGFSEAVLWVLEENAQARSFYERSGWAPEGATKTYEAGTVALRYRTALEGARPQTGEPGEPGEPGVSGPGT